MASWGDVNAALNRLVADGVITGFSTNIGDRNRDGPVLVGVTAGRGDGAESEAEAAVARALARIGLTAEVTVSPAAAAASVPSSL